MYINLNMAKLIYNSQNKTLWLNKLTHYVENMFKKVNIIKKLSSYMLKKKKK